MGKIHLNIDCNEVNLNDLLVSNIKPGGDGDGGDGDCAPCNGEPATNVDCDCNGNVCDCTSDQGDFSFGPDGCSCGVGGGGPCL